MKNTKTLLAAALIAACTISQPVLAQVADSATPPALNTLALENTDLNFAFEQTAQPLQMATLSEQEMKETEGAFINFFAGAVGGGAVGAGIYAYNNWQNNRPITWQGLAYSAGTGALVGAGGAALIARAGGGVLGNVAWRPSMAATNFSFSQYSSYRGW